MLESLAMPGATKSYDAGDMAILTELQGLTISPVAGEAAGTKMVIAAMREEDTIAAALIQGGVTTVGVSEVQHITVSATGGNFTITWNGQTTGSILATAAASVVQAALDALSNIAPGDVTVTGGPGDAAGTTPYILTWATYLGNVAQPTCSDVDMTGTATAVPSTATAGVQQVGGLFTDDKANITIQSVKATGTLTFSDVPTADDTVTVNGHVYTFKAADDATKNSYVAIGDGEEDTGDNLAAAINLVEGLTGNPGVVATSDGAGVVTITAVTDGVGNGPTVTDTGSTITISNTDPGAVTATCASVGNNDALTVNGITFTAKTTPTARNLHVALGDDDTAQAALFVAQIAYYQANVGDLGVLATSALGVVTITAKTQREGNTIKLSEDADNCTASGSGYLAGGTASGGIKSTTDLTGESLVVYWFNKR